jgi:hypothetical protein
MKHMGCQSWLEAFPRKFMGLADQAGHGGGGFDACFKLTGGEGVLITEPLADGQSETEIIVGSGGEEGGFLCMQDVTAHVIIISRVGFTEEEFGDHGSSRNLVATLSVVLAMVGLMMRWTKAAAVVMPWLG